MSNYPKNLHPENVTKKQIDIRLQLMQIPETLDP